MNGKKIPAHNSVEYKWEESNTYIKQPPFITGKKNNAVKKIEKCSILAIFGDSITTDHISPAGVIAKNTPAYRHLAALGIDVKDFNSYGSRRGNHEVMVRGTFANIRISNLLTKKEGGWTIYHPQNKEMSIYDAAMLYKASNTPLIVIAGKEYGTGSSRDWAAKGTALLGIRAVIAKSFERIHRSNLIGMGVLPVTFINCSDYNKLDGTKSVDLCFNEINIKQIFEAKIHGGDSIQLRLEAYTKTEVSYLQSNGILNYVADEILK